MATRSRRALALGLSWTAAMGGCDCGGVAATTEAVRCSDHEPPLEQARTVGAATLTPDARRLTITGLPETSRWVVGRGPALATEPFAPALDAIEALSPHAVIVLGGLGTAERLDEMVRELAAFEPASGPVPIFLVPGPRDRVAALDAALAAHDAAHVVSLAGVHVIEVGAVELLVAAGSVEPRYVLEGGCHLADLDEVIDEGTGERVRVLVGFDAPSGTRLTAGLDGVEAGSDAVRDALAEAGFGGGIFAGPDTVLGRFLVGDAPASGPAADARVIVPPLLGPSLEGADGARTASQPTLVLVGPRGIGPGPAGGPS